jgi:hypothetical protein
MPSSILNSDDGVISGTSGLKSSGGDDGVTVFQQNGTEAMRVDSSERLLIGSTSARANLFNSTVTASFQVEGTDSNTSNVLVARNSNDTTGAIVALVKSRGGSVGSNTVVQSGDNVGLISFQGSDGTEFVEAARIQVAVDGTPGANDMPGRIEFRTTADGGTSTTEQMRLTSAGNLQFNSGYGSVVTAYGCRAWVNFNGTTNVGGFCTIRASGNVSSITDNGTGSYTVNFTTAMPDANYCAVGSSKNISGAGGQNLRFGSSSYGTDFTTTAVNVQTTNAGNQTQTDSEMVSVSIFR